MIINLHQLLLMCLVLGDAHSHCLTSTASCLLSASGRAQPCHCCDCSHLILQLRRLEVGRLPAASRVTEEGQGHRLGPYSKPLTAAACLCLTKRVHIPILYQKAKAPVGPHLIPL